MHTVFTTRFLLTSLVVVLIPGTGVLYTVSVGFARDWRASVAAAIGCTFGIVPHLAASALGLSAIMHLGAEVFTGVKLVGSAYLLFLAWQMWRDTGTYSVCASSTWKTVFAVSSQGTVHRSGWSSTSLYPQVAEGPNDGRYRGADLGSASRRFYGR